MHPLHLLLPLASLAWSIPNPHPIETGAAGHAPARAGPPDARAAAELDARAGHLARQNGGGGLDYAPLLTLASLAGIPLPTDPAELFSLAPIASELLQALPTAPVLSVLETAAPSGFISSIVHDPGFAASFESAFAAGSSPDWFVGLPASVKDYLHTYQGILTVAGDLPQVVASVTSAEAAAASSSGGGLSGGGVGGVGGNRTTTRSSTTDTQTGSGIVVTPDTSSASASQLIRTSLAPSSSTGGAAARGGTLTGGNRHGVGAAAVGAAALVLGAAVVL